MPDREIIFLHGYGGGIGTYGATPEMLRNEGYAVSNIHLGEYATGMDDVSMDDFAIELENAINERNIQKPFDIIIHSTGALVVRAWISKYYSESEDFPIKNFIMGAPANNGSRLANWGKKMPWDWGNKVLEGLKLASGYTWDLGWDWIDKRYHEIDGFNMFHIQGTKNDLDLPGFIDWADDLFNIKIPVFEERGSDNTVRVCAANPNMNGVKIGLDQKISDSEIKKIDGIPIYLFEDRSHFGEEHGILGAIKESDDEVYKTILSILEGNPVEPTEISNYPENINYLMINIKVCDQIGNIVEDFIPRFYFKEGARNPNLTIKHRVDNNGIHCYYLEFGDLAQIKKFGFRIPRMKVGEVTYNRSNYIDLYWPEENINFMEPYKTHLIEIKVKKELSDEAMVFTNPG